MSPADWFLTAPSDNEAARLDLSAGGGQRSWSTGNAVRAEQFDNGYRCTAGVGRAPPGKHGTAVPVIAACQAAAGLARLSGDSTTMPNVPNTTLNNSVSAGSQAALALKIHRQWCSTPFCCDVNADDWAEAAHSVDVWRGSNDQRD